MSLKIESLDTAVKEAARFIGTARAAKRRLQEDEYASITGSAETAACRRASMDLTRALANLRKGQ